MTGVVTGVVAMTWVNEREDVSAAVAAADHGGEVEDGWSFDGEHLVLGPMSPSTANGLRSRLQDLGLEASSAYDSDAEQSWVYLTPVLAEVAS